MLPLPTSGRPGALAPPLAAPSPRPRPLPSLTPRPPTRKAELKRCSALVVPHQRVGQAVRERVHWAGGRHADAPQLGAAGEVLHARLEPWGAAGWGEGGRGEGEGGLMAQPWCSGARRHTHSREAEVHAQRRAGPLPLAPPPLPPPPAGWWFGVSRALTRQYDLHHARLEGERVQEAGSGVALGGGKEAIALVVGGKVRGGRGREVGGRGLGVGEGAWGWGKGREVGGGGLRACTWELSRERGKPVQGPAPAHPPHTPRPPRRPHPLPPQSPRPPHLRQSGAQSPAPPGTPGCWAHPAAACLRGRRAAWTRRPHYGRGGGGDEGLRGDRGGLVVGWMGGWVGGCACLCPLTALAPRP